MRGILTDWLIQVHSRFRLLPKTLFLCVNIIDRFLSKRVVSLAKLQLVSISCMFIAAKVEEIVAPSAQNFLYCADSSYTEAEISRVAVYAQVNHLASMHLLHRTSPDSNKLELSPSFKCGISYEVALKLAKDLDVALNDLLWDPV